MPAADEGRVKQKPRVTLVLATIADPGALRACLMQLLPEAAELGAEIVVAAALDAPAAAALRTSFPAVRVQPCPAGTSIQALRAAGMRAATGDVVALADADCGAARDRLRRLLASAR